MEVEALTNFGIENKSLTHEAASWVAQIDRGDLSAKDKLSLAEWISRSPAHVKEIREMAALWGGVDAAIDDAMALQNPSKLTALNFLKNAFKVSPAPAIAVFSALLFATFITVSQLNNGNLEQPTVEAQRSIVLVAEKGDRLMRTLEDGSVIHLNTDSVLEVNYTADYRQLKLIRGEALFDVQKDPQRPFQVVAKGQIAEAVGTQFSVRIDTGRVAVTVSEGRVKLDNTQEPDASLPKRFKKLFVDNEDVFLSAGQSASIINNKPQVLDLNPVIIERKMAWMQDEFVFAGEPLSYVVSEITRYNDVEIGMAPELRGKPIGGRFKTKDVDRILEALELSEGIKVKRYNDGAIYLSE